VSRDEGDFKVCRKEKVGIRTPRHRTKRYCYEQVQVEDSRDSGEKNKRGEKSSW